MMTFTINRYRNRLLERLYQNREIKPEALRNLRTLEGIDLRKGLLNTDYVVIDTELTGLDLKRDSILSIGALWMSGSAISLGNYFYRVVDPSACLNPSSVIIHGITPGEASRCPTVDRVMPEFVDYCKDRVVIGHCVSIDKDFINKEMRRLYGFGLQNPFVDTLKIYWWYKRKRLGYDAFSEETTFGTSSLFEIANELDVPAREGHNALSDAFITAQIFQRLLPILIRKGITGLSDLLRIAGA